MHASKSIARALRCLRLINPWQMNIETFREYCLSKKATTEDFPFDQETLVFKVGGKMFALTGIEQFQSINLKCDPELAIELREKYDGITPGYHMNKKHWNSVKMDGSVPMKVVQKMIDDSYSLVVSSLPKREREKLGL
jgi:predicted DNA-binding protein (MmcQ/YjbR family)